MPNIPSNYSDTDVYKVLNLILSSKDYEIDKLKDSFSENEKKVYQVCLDVLQAKKDDKKLAAVIHYKVSGQGVNEMGETSKVFFGSIAGSSEGDLKDLVSLIKVKAEDSLGSIKSIVEKITDKSQVVDLAAQFKKVLVSPPGVKDFMHRIFLTTNEEIPKEVWNQLKKEPLHGNTVVQGDAGKTFIGVSGFYSLNVAAIRGDEAEQAGEKLETIIILDRSENVENFWKEMTNIITSSQTRYEVLEKLETLYEESQLFEVPDSSEMKKRNITYSPMNDLLADVKAGTSWLSDAKKFKRIKEIFDNKNFIFKRIDLTDMNAMQSLQTALKENKRNVDTLYVSNISEYLQSGTEFEAYKEGIKKLAGKETLLIDTIPRKSKNEKLKQRIIRINEIADKLIPSELVIYDLKKTKDT